MAMASPTWLWPISFPATSPYCWARARALFKPQSTMSREFILFLWRWGVFIMMAGPPLLLPKRDGTNSLCFFPKAPDHFRAPPTIAQELGDGTGRWGASTNG